MNPLLDKVHAGLCDHLAGELGDTWSKLTELCESPIEIALGASLLLYDRIYPTPGSNLILSIQGFEADHYGPEARLLIPQYTFEDKRLDFLLREPPFEIFIECDGHDFHERTKEQAARDRRRDREIQQFGRSILRFTGSEIWRDPVGCAMEVFEFVSDQHMHHHLATRTE